VELRDIQEQLDEAEGESWIEEFLDSANTNES